LEITLFHADSKLDSRVSRLGIFDKIGAISKQLEGLRMYYYIAWQLGDLEKLLGHFVILGFAFLIDLLQLQVLEIFTMVIVPNCLSASNTSRSAMGRPFNFSRLFSLWITNNRNKMDPVIGLSTSSKG
jgi:hypothetical protein